MNKDLQPRNSKGQRHGYWEIYCKNKLWFRTVYNNGKLNGFAEFYWENYGKLSEKTYYL